MKKLKGEITLGHTYLSMLYIDNEKLKGEITLGHTYLSMLYIDNEKLKREITLGHTYLSMLYIDASSPSSALMGLPLAFFKSGFFWIS